MGFLWGKLLQPRQSDSATVHAGGPQFADEWDAYQDVLDTITGWDGITITPAAPAQDGLPTSFELCGPGGQRVDAEVSGGSIAGEWTLEFSSPEMELTAENLALRGVAVRQRQRFIDGTVEVSSMLPHPEARERMATQRLETVCTQGGEYTSKNIARTETFSPSAAETLDRATLAAYDGITHLLSRW